MSLLRHRLVLYPDAPVRIEATVLADSLCQAGLCGDRINALGSMHYAPGAAFAELVTFLGCSPVIGCGPQSWDDDRPNLYHVEIETAAPAFVLGLNSRAPRCPACGTAASTLNASCDEGLVALCTHCGEAAPLRNWRFRHQAAFGPVMLSVWGVHEGEAVPSERLLAYLQETMDCDWAYAWLRHDKQSAG